MEAKAGKEQEVERFLTGAAALVAEETGTVVWFAVRLGPSTFGIFDAFDDEAGRDAHLNGRVAEALFGQADSLFASAPSVQKLDVLADKLTASDSGNGPQRVRDRTGWTASEWSDETDQETGHAHSVGDDEHDVDRDTGDRAGGWNASEWSNTDQPRE